MATKHDPGLRHRPYISGVNLLKLPDTITERPMRAESVERMADSFSTIDRPVPFAGAPDVIQKYEWDIGFPRVGEVDYPKFADIEGVAGFFDFCLWKPISETFSGDGETTKFYSMRRDALTYIPSGALPVNAATIYATVVTVNGSETTDYTDDGAPDGRGVLGFTFDSAPGAGVGNIIRRYVPLFYAYLETPERVFAATHQEKRTVRFVEI